MKEIFHWYPPRCQVTSALVILISVVVSSSSFLKICKTKDCHSVTVQHDLGGTRLGEVLKIVVLCRWVMNSAVSQKYYHTTDMYRSLADWYYSLNICIYQWSMAVNYFICYAIFFFSYYGVGGLGASFCKPEQSHSQSKDRDAVDKML